MLKVSNTLIWDPCFVQSGQTHYAFYAQGSLSGSERGIGSAHSSDLYNWTPNGLLFTPSQNGWDNKSVWPGSVVQDQNGLWHLFYTGHGTQTPLIQSIGHATSLDLKTWDRVNTGLALDMTDPSKAFYQTKKSPMDHTRILRDPFVFQNPKRDGWLMLFAARAAGLSLDTAACIGLASSPDLMTWTLEKPLFAGGYSEIEHPHLFRRGNTWYILYSAPGTAWGPRTAEFYNTAPDDGIHYIKAPEFEGPWSIPQYGFLGRHLFAAKLIHLQDRCFVIGNYHGDNRAHDGTLTHPLRLGFGQSGLMLQNGVN